MHQSIARSLDSTGTDSGEFGVLPQWDLGDLYSSDNAPELSRDLGWLKQECADFADNYQGKLIDLDTAGLLNCIQRYEKIKKVGGRILSFAHLRLCLDTTDAQRTKFYSDCQQKFTEATEPLVFFELEINRVDEERLEGLLAGHAGLGRYKPILDDIRAMKPYQLSDEMERFLHDLGAVNDAWSRLFDETLARLEFRVAEDVHSLEGTLSLLLHHDRSRREAAARELARVFSDNIGTFARIHNTQVKEKEIIDRWRKLPTPQFARHLSNRVEPEVVDALRIAVADAYPRLSHRYYDLKRQWLGLDRLQIWDRNAPLPMKSSRTISWDEARGTVMDAYAAFDPRMAELAAPFFEKGWIDAGVRPGKTPGAFSHPTVTDVHPYILLNYLGKPHDVMTLAHELGHGVHQILAASQGELLSSTPLTLAETASVFGEMLTFRKMLDETADQAQRKVLLAEKVEDMINTVVRQVAFFDFECRLHEARRGGELTPDDFGQIWMSVQRDSLGPAFEFMDGYETFWAYIPHFVHSPFYVYAYAFGEGVVGALYQVYTAGMDGFEDKYFDMLRAGGSKHHKELFAPFGIDATDPGFWSCGLNIISGYIDELLAMEGKGGHGTVA